MASANSSVRLQRAVLRAAASVLDDDWDSKPNRVSLWLFADETQKLLDVKFSARALNEVRSRASRWYRQISNMVVGLLLVLNIYLVLGCLIEGRSNLTAQSVVSVVLLVLLLLLLAAVEALHISVAVLRLKDLTGVKSDYPRTFALHQVFKSEEGAERFLAGRQFMVITVVFVIAQLTGFKDVEHWPGTHFRIPDVLHPLISTFLLEFGMAGAFLALWFAQLAPQFAANRRPLRLMNSRAIGVLFNLALVAEFLGFTRPGAWLASRVRSDPEIPGSSQERYRQGVQVTGIALTSVCKAWSIERSHQVLYYNASAIVEAPKVREVIDSGLMYSLRAPRSLQWSGQYQPPTEGSVANLVTIHEEKRETGGWQVHRLAMHPAYRQYFEVGGIVSCHASLTGSAPEPGRFRDAFLISAPTKFVLFRAEFVDVPSELSDVKVRVIPVSSTSEVLASDTSDPQREQTLDFKREADKFVLECCVTYPPIGSYIEVDWTYRW
jgi:hypothetical protein